MVYVSHMTSNENRIIDVCKHLLDNNIDLDDINSAEMIEIMGKLSVIKNHTRKIWQTNKGIWKTYVTDESKPKNRRLIEAKSRTNLDNKIYEEWKKAQEKPKTFSDVCNEWKDYKQSISLPENFSRILTDYKRFYVGSPFMELPIKDITSIDCSRFIANTITKNKLQAQGEKNMRIIINQTFDYALQLHYIDENPLARLRSHKNLLTPTPRKTGKTQVFSLDENREIIEAITKDEANLTSTIPYAILFAFQLPIRVGELITLKWSDVDFDNKIITIQRTETSFTMYNNGLKSMGSRYRLKESTKGAADYRDVPLSDAAMTLLHKVKAFNDARGIDDGFIFHGARGTRVHRQRVNDVLYHYCDIINASRKSSHKIRKTVISKWLDNHMNLDSIALYAGHQDKRTTLGNYCFDRRGDEANRDIMNMCS